MGKHQRHRRPGSIGASTTDTPAERRAHVEGLLERGKTQDALEAAKQFFKSTPTPDTESLLVDAYHARIRALTDGGLAHEARALAALVNARFPRQRPRTAPLLERSELRLSRNLPAVLAELATADPPRRRELEAILARELTDPQVLVESSLAEDDPLKTGARAVTELFAAVTAGPLADGALARLDSIARRSPLAPWKLLIRAIDAFYRRADEAVRANVSAIPSTSPPARLVPLLRRLIGEAPASPARSLAVTSLVDKVSGGRVPFESSLSQLVAAVHAGNRRPTSPAIRNFLATLPSEPSFARRCVVTVLSHCLRGGGDPNPVIQAVLQTRPGLETIRLSALGLEDAGLWDLALGMWDRYLNTAIQARVLPPSGPPASRVRLHMAALFPPDQDDVFDYFEVASEDELSELLRARLIPEYFDRARLLQRARADHPDPEVFRALVAYYDAREPKQAEAEAKAWHRAFPQDLEPLLYLARAAERRGAEQKALALLAEAEAINGLHPDVRRNRVRLLLARVERRIREGKLTGVAAELARLEAEPRAREADHPVYVHALGWAAARRASDDAAAEALEQALATQARNPVLVELVLGSVAKVCGVWEPARRPHSQPEAIEGLARAFDLFESLDRPLQVPEALFRQIEKGVSLGTEAQLYSLCACGLKLGRPGVAYVASGRGLVHGGPLLHRFLLARGQTLRLAGTDWELRRAHPCLRAARELARHARDMDAVREASLALDDLPSFPRFDRLLSDPFGPDDPFEDEALPTPEAISRLIAAERKCWEIPRFASRGTSARRSRRRRRKSTSPLVQLIRLLEEVDR